MKSTQTQQTKFDKITQKFNNTFIDCKIKKIELGQIHTKTDPIQYLHITVWHDSILAQEHITTLLRMTHTNAYSIKPQNAHYSEIFTRRQKK